MLDFADDADETCTCEALFVPRSSWTAQRCRHKPIAI